MTQPISRSPTNQLRRPIADLRPAPYNPRKPLKPGSRAFQKLARSLEEFGLVQPIVWNDQTGHVVAGHQRLEVLKHQGAADVEVVVVSLPLAREMALNVALNNSELASSWDQAKLADLVDQLRDLPNFDATLTGFDAEQLAAFHLAPPTSPFSVPPVDTPPAVASVVIEIPSEQFEHARKLLDDLLLAQPDWRLHVNP